MGPDIELKEKMESAPEVQFSKEIVPAPPFPKNKDFQPAFSKCNACATESLPIEKTPLSNGNEDVEVNITGCSNSGKTLVVEVACEDVMEYSSSFGDTLSGTENENCSAFSDVEVQSQIHSGNASSPMHDDCSEAFRIRKKKLTNHWRRFIHPLMWRCKWIELQLKQLQSQALKYDKELAIYDYRKQQEFANFALDGFGTKSVSFSGSIGRNKVMKRKKRKRVEAESELASYMSNHSLFYYENKNTADVAHLKDAIGIATGNAVNTEEFRWNDILSSLESKDSDKSLKDIILKIEAVHEQVHRLKTRIDMVISENPGKFTSVNKLSMHEPSDGLNHFERYPTSPASARSKNAFPVRPVKTELNMGDLLMPGNEGSSCGEMSPLIETTTKPQLEVLWQDTKVGVLIHNQVAKEELQAFENVRNELVKATDESVEERKAISPVRFSEPDLASEIAASNLQAAVCACSIPKSNLLRNRRRRRRKLS